MTIGEQDPHSFHYLMLFKDGRRIDLTLFPVDKFTTQFKKDSLTTLLLDKNNLIERVPLPSDKDYLIKRPTQKEFTDCCNEFWWVSTNVAKGLWREDITYAKGMLEIHLRNMFLKLIEWDIGIETDFSISFGQFGRNIKRWVSPELYNKILLTYPDSNIENIWKSLFLMTDIFANIAKKIANKLSLYYNEAEEKNVIDYLRWVQNKI